MSARPRKALARTCAGALACALAGPIFAQSSSGGRSLTLEELEAYIEEQKAALEQVERNREITREKEARVREELGRRESRRLELEAELRELCEERAGVGAGDAPEGCPTDASDPAG